MRKSSKEKYQGTIVGFVDGDGRKDFGRKLKDLMKDPKYYIDGKKITAEKLSELIEEKGGSACTLTVNKWMQGKIFPGEENLKALCEIFPPHSSDYFRGIAEAPNLNYQQFIQETGLSSKAIEKIKQLHVTYPDGFKAFFESDLLDSIIENTDASLFQQHAVEDMEFEILFKNIPEFMEYYYANAKAYRPDSSVDDEINEITKRKTGIIKASINCLSDENIEYTHPVARIEKFRRNIMHQIDVFFDSEIPPLKSERYQDLVYIFNEFIKPAGDECTIEYFNYVLLPLYNDVLVPLSNASSDNPIQNELRQRLESIVKKYKRKKKKQ